MFELLTVVCLIVVLVLMGLPVAFAFAIGDVILIWWLGLDLNFSLAMSFKLLQGFSLLALPLFIFAGILMEKGGAGKRLLDFVNSIVGRVTGGLGAALVVSNGIFGAISGSSSAAIGTLGTIGVPYLKKSNYREGYIVALIAASGILALLIPPSIDMIIFGVASRLSIAKLFLCTLMPGIMLMLAFIGINYVECRKNPPSAAIPNGDDIKKNTQTIAGSFRRGFVILLMPVFILGSIYSGIATPTEAAGIAVVYTFIVVCGVYRSLNLKGLGRAFIDACSLTGSIALLFFTLFILSQIMIIQQIPGKLAATLLTLTTNKYALLALLNIIMLFMGMLMDDVSGLLLAAIVLLPVAKQFGIDPYHFGAITGVNLGLGLLTPPVAPMLYLAARVAGSPPPNVFIKPALTFMLAGYLPVLLITMYLPQITLFLPNLLYH